MKRFDSLLEKDISGYSGKFSQLIVHAPALYRLMTRLLDDRDLPKQMSPLVIAAIAYFILWKLYQNYMEKQKAKHAIEDSKLTEHNAVVEKNNNEDN